MTEVRNNNTEGKSGVKYSEILANTKQNDNNSNIEVGDADDTNNDDIIQQHADSDLEDDEMGQDWSQISKLNKKNAQLIIPKRGEKDYEPDGTNIQELLLYRAREAMFDALSNSARGSIIKNQVKAIYIPDEHEALVLSPKGTFLQTMGNAGHGDKLWLNFNEFLYLAERGTVTPYYLKNDSIPLDILYEDENLLPLGIEDIYAFFKTQREMDEFSVYAHLKRLGFVVNRISDKDTTYYSTVQTGRLKSCTHSLFRQVTTLFVSQKTNLFNALFYNPLHYKFTKYTSTPQIYAKLKHLIPHVWVPKNLNQLQEIKKNSQDQKCTSNFLELTYNVWKPQTNYKKKNPNLPDYQVLVYNKNDNKQHFPTNDDLKHIFNSLNYKFEFLEEVDDDFNWDDHSYINNIPRSVALMQNQKKKQDGKSTSKSNNQAKPNKNKNKKTRVPSTTPHAKQMRRLKNGYRSFLLAVMDNGIISFIKISEADFGSEDVWYIPSNQPKVKKAQYQYKKRQHLKTTAITESTTA